MVGIEYLAHAVAVVVALRKIVVAVIGHEQRVEPVVADHLVRLVVAVLASAHRDQAIVVALLLANDSGDSFLEQLPAPDPEVLLQLLELLGHATRGTDALSVRA